ncbi:MAG: T9SS C-terminal target domain-containing protein [Calditrichaeota bacterium]|nr:T9SS type A sorting domain-containing protein [Calditrichota bacterium]RQW02514.1 MAG: T9SS C-terminal target domain-containing protein [Calditrichota bacterium]
MNNRERRVFTFILIYLILFTFTEAGAQPATWENYWGGYSLETGKSIQQTSDGGFIIAGGTYSFGAGSADMYLIKTDSLGNTEWTRTYGGPGDEIANAVRQTRGGGYILAGLTTSYGAGGEDIYLVRTDAQGDTLWTRTYGSSDDELAVCLQITHDYGYIIAKNTFSLLKTDSLGNLQWEQSYNIHPNSYYDDQASWVEQTIDGGYILTGHSSNFRYYPEPYEVCLIKTNPSGGLLWSQLYEERDEDYAYCVKQTADGHYLIAGSTESYGAGGSEAFLIKTDALGNRIWSQAYGSRYDDYGAFVTLTGNGNYLLGGTTDSFSPNRYDVWLIKTDTAGVVLGWGTAGGVLEEYGLAGQQTSEGDYVITGTTESFGAGATDVYAARLNVGATQSSLLQKLNEHFHFYDGPPLLPDMFTYPTRSQKMETNDPSLLDTSDLWVLLFYPDKINLMENNQINGEIDINNWYRYESGSNSDEFTFDLSTLGGYLPWDLEKILTDFLHLDCQIGPWILPAEPIRQSNGNIDTVTATFSITLDGEVAGTSDMILWYDEQLQDLRGQASDYIMDLSVAVNLPDPFLSFDTTLIRIPLIPDSIQAIYFKTYTPDLIRSKARLKLPDPQTPLPTINDLIPQSFILSHLLRAEIGYHLSLRAPFMNFDIDTLGNLNVLLEIVLSTFDYQSSEVIESPLFPAQLSYSEIEIFPPLINMWIHNELETPFTENNLHYEHSLGQGEIHSTLPDSAFSSHHLVVLGEGPIDLELTDPENQVIIKTLNPVSNTIYVENDINGDLQQDDLILIPYGKPNGEYRVKVVAESGASPNDTYTLQATFSDTILVLAQNTLISDIPAIPYTIGPLYNGLKESPDDIIIPEKFILYQNYPNPFNAKTVISWQLAVDSDVTLEIYNIRGQKIADLFSGSLLSGSHSVKWDASDLASGVYLYRLEVLGNGGKRFSECRKMLLLK